MRRMRRDRGIENCNKNNVSDSDISTSRRDQATRGAEKIETGEGAAAGGSNGKSERWEGKNSRTILMAHNFSFL